MFETNTIPGTIGGLMEIEPERTEPLPNPELRNKSVFVRRVGEYVIYKMYDAQGRNPVEATFPTKPMFSDEDLIEAGFMRPA